MPAPHHPQDTEFLMTHPGFKGFFPWATDPVLLAEGQGFRLYQVLYQPGRPYVVEEGHYMQLVFAEDQPGAVGITGDISFPQVLSINHFWLLAVDGREDTLPEWACEPSWQFGDTQYIALW